MTSATTTVSLNGGFYPVNSLESLFGQCPCRVQERTEVGVATVQYQRHRTEGQVERLRDEKHQRTNRFAGQDAQHFGTVDIFLQ